MQEAETQRARAETQRARAETQGARAETDRVRDKAQADILAMAMEKASAITSRDAAFAELEKTRSELKEVRTVTLPTVHITTPAPTTNTPVEPLMVTPMGTTPPPASEHPASARLSERLPDPDKFTGARSDLRRFATQIRGKMTSNKDRFPNPESRLIYVAGRLSGKAYNLILPKMVGGTPQFGDYTDLLQYLEEAFGDPDHVQNAQNKLYALKQRN
ncbi:gag protein, partial [Pyricularia oryzae]